MHVVVGLGNPGDKYKKTRHNIGFMTVDFLADELGIKVNKIKHQALIGEGKIKGEKIIIVKPQTFMNLSGNSVRDILNYYKIPTENLIVIYDDVDIDFNAIRVKPKGSGGTHNGMRSILSQIGTEEFPRVRMGIGSSPHIPIHDYVIGKFTKDELKNIDKFLKAGAEAVKEIVTTDVDSSMNKYNGNI